jgi:hypothetical protein
LGRHENTRSEIKMSKIFPPYIDAYCEDEYSKTETKWSLKQFKERLQMHAMEWGEQCIGHQVIENGEYLKDSDDLPIFCVGWFHNLDKPESKLRNFICSYNKDAKDFEDRYKVKEEDWDDECDVT